jgi:hypothetical protein
MSAFAFLCAAAAPVALWHHAIGAVAEDFRLEPGYLTGWSGFALIGLGLLLMLPVVVARPRFRNVYMGWGVSLYLLGLALASQVAAAVG